MAVAVPVAVNLLSSACARCAVSTLHTAANCDHSVEGSCRGGGCGGGSPHGNEATWESLEVVVSSLGWAVALD